MLSVAVVAASCGGNKKPDGSSSGQGDGLSTAKVSNGDSEAKPTPGGTLTLALEAETSGGWCMPEAQLASAGIQVANLVYDPLVAFDADFKPQPYLAQSVEVNPEHTLFTFTLRPNIKFHDGTPLTARAVKLNLDLWKGDEATKAATGRQPLLFPLTFKDMGDVTVLDDLTFTVATKRPWVAFLDYLASGRSGIAAEAQIRADDASCRQDLIGTGPFRIVKWDRNVELDLERNPDYWMKDEDGVQLPYLDKVVVKPIPASPDRLAALEGGAADAIVTAAYQSVERVSAEPDRYNMASDTKGHRDVLYLMLNVSKPPFDDLEVRKAVRQGIDRERLNRINSGGHATLANGPFDTDVVGYLPGLDPPEYDPDSARTVLEGRNLSFTLSYAPGPSSKEVGEEIQREMGQVGVKVDFAVLDQSTTANKAIAGDFHMLIMRNHPGLDPDTQYPWFYSTSPVNFPRLKDPELDQLWDEGRTTTDPDARKAIYEKVNQRMYDQAYNLWISHPEVHLITVKDVKNFSNYRLPDEQGVASIEGAGMNWGWSYLTGVWRQK